MGFFQHGIFKINLSIPCLAVLEETKGNVSVALSFISERFFFPTFLGGEKGSPYSITSSCSVALHRMLCALTCPCHVVPRHARPGAGLGAAGLGLCVGSAMDS